MVKMYNQKHIWNVEVLNPVSNDVLSSKDFNTINDIAEEYSNINLNTWRNICMGRSKIYNNFIKVEKKPKPSVEPITIDFN